MLNNFVNKIQVVQHLCFAICISLEMNIRILMQFCVIKIGLFKRKMWSQWQEYSLRWFISRSLQLSDIAQS